MQRTINLCIVGFGNASQAFCRLLIDHKTYLEDTLKTSVNVTAIAGRSKGVLMDHRGIDLEKALFEVKSNGVFSLENPQITTGETHELIRHSEADVMIELSTLSIKDGQPAIHYIETAFEAGMHVITANKGPIAWNYRRLMDIAGKNGLSFLHETVVMDGAPIFNLVRETLPGCNILSFKGILNSTTNFILEEMEKGAAYEDAVKSAQLLGFAEADPSLDVEGWDAAAKTCALMNVLMNTDVTPYEIDRQGITHITNQDLSRAADQGGKLKLLCEAFHDGHRFIGRVYPSLIRRDDLFSTIDATTSILSIQTDLMGEICIVERNPKIEQTGYGIFSDLLTLIKRQNLNP
jgi:homoserine dehydrogenase